MTTVAHGPYEHVGAYAELAESEVFDTSDTEISFCTVCEHAPCVAGGLTWCSIPPRVSTYFRYEKEIRDSVDLTAADALLLLGLLELAALVASSSDDSYEARAARGRMDAAIVKVRAATAEEARSA